MHWVPVQAWVLQMQEPNLPVPRQGSPKPPGTTCQVPRSCARRTQSCRYCHMDSFPGAVAVADPVVAST